MISSTCPICKGSTFDGTGHSCWGWQPAHERGTTLARYDSWYTPWHRPRMGLMTVQVEIQFETDEAMADNYLTEFGRRAEDVPTLIEGHRVASASFVPYERPEPVA